MTVAFPSRHDDLTTERPCSLSHHQTRRIVCAFVCGGGGRALSSGLCVLVSSSHGVRNSSLSVYPFIFLSVYLNISRESVVFALFLPISIMACITLYHASFHYYI